MPGDPRHGDRLAVAHHAIDAGRAIGEQVGRFIDAWIAGVRGIDGAGAAAEDEQRRTEHTR
jgi:hypothetical protein